MDHIIVITRWRERYAEYERYTDHHATNVTYITTEVGLPAVPRTAADIWVVGATDDLGAVREGARALAARFGAPRHIVALKEDDLLVGATLRAEWGCPGPTVDQVLPFRDKFLMSRAVAAACLPVEPFAPAPDPAAVRAFAAAHGWPVVVKPRADSASEGVERLAGPSDVDPAVVGPGMLVQAYNPNPVYHVDGVYDDGLRTWRAARYLNTCLQFREGSVLGSVEEDDPDLAAVIGAATQRFLAALASGPTVFHLETFVDTARGRCVFLEVGARVGGGETALLWREVHGYDLMEQAYRIQLGRPVRSAPPQPAPGRGGGEICGHLLVPAPAPLPCRITEVTATLGAGPGPYAQVLPRVGDVLPAAASRYEHVGGRFRFRGPSTAAVTEAIEATAARFQVAAEPVRPAPAKSTPC